MTTKWAGARCTKAFAKRGTSRLKRLYRQQRGKDEASCQKSSETAAAPGVATSRPSIMPDKACQVINVQLCISLQQTPEPSESAGERHARTAAARWLRACGLGPHGLRGGGCFVWILSRGCRFGLQSVYTLCQCAYRVCPSLSFRKRVTIIEVELDSMRLQAAVLLLDRRAFGKSQLAAKSRCWYIMYIVVHL